MSRTIILLFLCLFGAAFFAQAEQAGFVYDDGGKRDPFWRLVGSSGEIINYDKEFLSSDMVLEGIMVEPGGNNVAVINGMIVKVGDEIGAYIVKGVNMDSVTLQKGSEVVTLRIKKED